MYPIHDTDAQLLLATLIAAKRRPAALTDIVAAAEFMGFPVTAPAAWATAFERFFTHGLLSADGEGYVLTPAAVQLVEGLPKKAEADERVFLVRERLAAMKADAATLAASSDSLLKAAATLQPALLRLEEEGKQRSGELMRLRPAYMQALIGYRNSQGKAVYPDANSSLRITFGNVMGYTKPGSAKPEDAFTTLEQVAAKATGKDPFDAPQVQLDAIKAKRYAGLADATLKTVPVNFMSDLDITGGNSGSPVLDAEGKLIGLNFDSNWEAVSASWMFDPRYKRAIHVYMRYLRWLLAKVYPAPQLLKEMNLPAE